MSSVNQMLQVEGATLHIEVLDQTLSSIDQPETIIFCHGVATNCDIWSGWLPVLSPYYRIVRFDTRGFGRSTLKNSKKPWSMDDLSQDILSVAKATHTESFHLVGESMGGTACLYLATQANHPLLSLTCVSTSHQGGRVQRVSSWREEVERSGIEAWSDEMMERRFFPDALTKDQWHWFSNLQKETSADALLEGGELLMRTDLSQDLGKINIPTLLLAPDSSPFIPVEIPKEVHAKIEGSKLVVMPHSRHGLPFSHAGQCSELLLDFLNSLKT